MFDFKHSGGQVRPIPHRANKTTGIDEEMPHTPGMSLRDYFAGQALMGILAGGFADTVPHDDVSGGADAAFFAYQYADAMLAQREKSQ